MSPKNNTVPSSKEIADQVAKNFFGVGSGKALNRATIRRFVVCAVICAMLAYLRFGDIPSFGWGTAIFLAGICILTIIGWRFPTTDVNKDSNRTAIRDWLVTAVICTVLIPLVIYMRFGDVNGFGWGVTVFFVVYCILVAIGLYFREHT